MVGRQQPWEAGGGRPQPVTHAIRRGATGLLTSASALHTSTTSVGQCLGGAFLKTTGPSECHHRSHNPVDGAYQDTLHTAPSASSSEGVRKQGGRHVLATERRWSSPSGIAPGTLTVHCHEYGAGGAATDRPQIASMC